MRMEYSLVATDSNDVQRFQIEGLAGGSEYECAITNDVAEGGHLSSA